MLKSIYADMNYIENKYHRTDKPFNPYRRMNYHGYEYDSSTGLDDEQMDAGLLKLSEKVKDLPHPVAKAKMFEYVLDNARIDVNENDWFVGFYNWGRPILKYTSTPWKKETLHNLPETEKQIDILSKTGTMAMWPDFDHVIPNWDVLLSLGFSGLLKRTEEYHNLHKKSGISEETDAFFTGIEISYNAILRLLERYYNYALTKNNEKSKLQAECFRNLREGAPKNLYEALQAMYIFFIVCECVDNFQTRSLGNGLDNTLYGFYTNDIKSGSFTENEEKEFMAYFFMQFSAIGNYWGHPMYLGGTNADGSTKINELSYAILDIYKELKIYNPKIQVKVSENTPKEFLFKVYDLIRNGITSFVFCCEPGYMKAVMGYGATIEEARNFEISGCYETRIRSNESSTATGYINAAKMIELVFNNGIDMQTSENVGIRTGEISDFKTFEYFYYAFLNQWSYVIEKSIQLANSFECKLDYINPSNIYSATIENSLKKGVDGYSFGVKFNNTALLCCGLASAVDSIMAVKKLCFDTKTVSLTELKKALQNNWVGYEHLRAKALNLPNKYGNGDTETDMFATAMAEYFCNKVNNRPNARGGVYKTFLHSAMQFVWQGEKTAALPDGRKANTELSKNASPVSGMDKCGVTALILSASKLPLNSFREASCLDVMLHPSAIEGEDGLMALDGLLMTFLKKDGMAIQFNVFNSELLRDAQKNPQKYKNLQVRVCGWNVLWNNLSKEEQDSYILRAENILH